MNREATIFCAGVCSSVYKTFQSVDGIINPMSLSVIWPFLRTKAAFQQVVSVKSPFLRTGVSDSSDIRTDGHKYSEIRTDRQSFARRIAEVNR